MCFGGIAVQMLVCKAKDRELNVDLVSGMAKYGW